MKTVEVTRHKGLGGASVSTMKIASDIFKKEGIRGINKGVNAVAIRQMTNWGSRFGISRIVEDLIHKTKRKLISNNNKQENTKNKIDNKKLSPIEKILASGIGGALSCWNQPIEVIRVELQSQIKHADRPAKLSIIGAAKYIVKKNGFKGLYRGVVPRICLGMWQTICMVSGGDWLKVKEK